jgi:ABC-type multidrug transport system fused ATPase/permease subunit
VIEEGSHQQLMKKNGLYKRLVSVQIENDLAAKQLE